MLYKFVGGDDASLLDVMDKMLAGTLRFAASAISGLSVQDVTAGEGYRMRLYDHHCNVSSAAHAL